MTASSDSASVCKPSGVANAAKGPIFGKTSCPVSQSLLSRYSRYSAGTRGRRPARRNA